MKSIDVTPEDVVRADKAKREALTTSAGDAGAEVPDRVRPVQGSELGRKLKDRLGIINSDPV